MDETEIWTVLNEVLVEEFKLDPKDIKPEANFYDDLGLDSLDLFTAVSVIEERFRCHIQLEDEELMAVRTPADAVALLLKKAPRSA